jgi:hypothetical protein
MSGCHLTRRRLADGMQRNPGSRVRWLAVEALTASQLPVVPRTSWSSPGLEHSLTTCSLASVGAADRL